MMIKKMSAVKNMTDNTALAVLNLSEQLMDVSKQLDTLTVSVGRFNSIDDVRAIMVQTAALRLSVDRLDVEVWRALFIKTEEGVDTGVDTG